MIDKNETKEFEHNDSPVNALVNAKLVDENESSYIFSLEFDQKAFVPKYEFSEKPSPEQPIALLIGYKTANLMWTASHIQAQHLLLWKELEKAAKEEKALDCFVVAHNEHGLVADVLGVRAFVPKSQIDIYEVEDTQSYVGKSLKCRILKFDSRDANLVVSPRLATEAALLEKKEALLSDLKVDNVYDGVVRRITEYGVFVDIGYGVEGMVHRTNLSWGRVIPAERCKIGDALKVIVLKVNGNDGKIDLGHKQLTEDPWSAYTESVKIGDIVTGRIITLTNFGAFVELAPEIDSLIHISEMSWNDHIKHPKQILKTSQEVRAKVIAIEPENRRIKLSIRQCEENPWLALAEKFKPGDKATLPISGLADFGLFVEMQPGFDALIHVNDVQWNASESIRLSERFHVGDMLECVVLSVDPEAGRASFGLKQLHDDPWLKIDEIAKVGTKKPVTVKRIARFGAFVEIVPNVEGLIHISELSINRVQRVEDVLQIDDRVEATIISVDKNRRRIGLSLIQDEFDASEEEVAVSEEQEHATLSDIFPENLKS